MMNVLSPTGFLKVGGIILVLVAILGFIGIIGPTPERSLFGEFWWFDNAENLVHLILGVVALAAVYSLKDAQMQKWLVLIVGVVALAFGIINFFLPGEAPNFYGVANLESPADTILHLLIGVWGIVAGTKKESSPMAAM